MNDHGSGVAVVIDDNDIDRMLYERIIARSGVFARIESFADPADALALLRSGRAADVRAIFTDIRMPAMSGFDFLGRLETLRVERGSAVLDAVVAIVTTSSDRTDRARAESFAAVRFYFDEPLSVASVEQVGRYLDERILAPGSSSS